MNPKLGQLFFIGLSGPALTSDEKKFIVENNIGGVTLFGRNCVAPEQIHALCSELQSLRQQMPDKAPLFIAVDMEGGRVARLKAPFTVWPPARQVSQLDSTSMAFEAAQAMGRELRAVGINLDFAPCVDVLTNPKNQVIGDRSYGEHPEQVSKIASAVVRGYIKSDILPCAKHFPGHGNTLLDSHEDLPVETLTLAELERDHLPPFKKVFRSRLELVMTSHIKYTQIDPEWPVTLSEIFLTQLLRHEFRYRNLVITDDLDMKALTNNYSRELIPVRALQAGADLLLYCNVPESERIAVEAVQRAAANKELDLLALTTSYKKVLELKKSKLTNPDPQPFSAIKQWIGHASHLELAAAIVRGEKLVDDDTE